MKPRSPIRHNRQAGSSLAPWFYWLLLCATAALGGVLGGAPLPQIAIAVLFSATPAVVGATVSFWSDRARASEIETFYGVLFATLAVALSGGAGSPLVIFYAPPLLAALANGRGRLALEATAFSVVGYAVAALAVRHQMAPTMEGLVKLSPPLAICSLVLAGVFAARAASRYARSAPATAAVDDTRTRREIDYERRRAQQAEAARDEAVRRADAAEASLLEAKSRASSSDAALAERMRFFAQTNHELRTPLNAILGFSDVLKHGLFGPLNDKYREYAELIQEGGRSLQVVVDDVLDLSRIEAGRYEIMPERLSLNDAVTEATRFMADQAARRGVKLGDVLTENVEAYADARAVRQIALNLISNALKFTADGGEVRIWARQHADGAAEFGVSDTGRGIAAEDIAKLAKPFEQSGAKEGRGAGLGLSVVRAFVDLHGGALKIESTPGEGSDISVVFPAGKDAGR